MVGTFDAENGWITITAHVGGYEAGVTLPTIICTIERRSNGEAWVQVGEAFNTTTTFVDKAPTTRGVNEYRATSESIARTTTQSENLQIVTSELFGYISTGNNFSEVSRLNLNMTFVTTDGVEKTLHQVVDSPLPHETIGNFYTSTIACTAVLDPAINTVTELQNVALTRGPVLWRDPTGRRIFGSLSPIQGSQDWTELATVSFTITRLDHKE